MDTRRTNADPHLFCDPLDSATYCCGMFERVANRYPATLALGINLINARTGEAVHPAPWIMYLYEYTSTDRIAQSHRGWVLLRYCPFCGKPVPSGPTDNGVNTPPRTPEPARG